MSPTFRIKSQNSNKIKISCFHYDWLHRNYKIASKSKRCWAVMRSGEGKSHSWDTCWKRLLRIIVRITSNRVRLSFLSQFFVVSHSELKLWDLNQNWGKVFKMLLSHYFVSSFLFVFAIMQFSSIHLWSCDE